MTTQVESAWPSYPDYRIDIEPCPHRAQVWLDDLLIADSDSCLAVTESDHVDRLYFPEAAVRWNLFTPTDYTTMCPFKGQASYWSLSAGELPIENPVGVRRSTALEYVTYQH